MRFGIHKGRWKDIMMYRSEHVNIPVPRGPHINHIYMEHTNIAVITHAHAIYGTKPRYYL